MHCVLLQVAGPYFPPHSLIFTVLRIGKLEFTAVYRSGFSPRGLTEAYIGPGLVYLGSRLRPFVKTDITLLSERIERPICICLISTVQYRKGKTQFVQIAERIT